MATCGSVSKMLSTFNECTKCPELFLLPQHEKTEEFKNITKSLYHLTRKSANIYRKVKCNALHKLITKNFDTEQIWQQLELQNNPYLSHFNKDVFSLTACDVSLGIDVHEPDGNILNDEVTEIEKKNDEQCVFSDDDGDSELLTELQNKQPKKPTKETVQSKLKTIKSVSVVNDKFFKLSELEEFLNREELNEERKSNASSDDIDLFADISSDDDGENGDDFDSNDIQKPSKAMYEDFFDAPERTDEEISQHSASPKMQDSSSESEAVVGDEEDYDTRDCDPTEVNASPDVEQFLGAASDSDDSETNQVKKTKSTEKTPFEKQQEKSSQKIRELEESNLGEKPWQLMGEVTAESRPLNSLLQEDVLFDSNVKSNITVTEDYTKMLEKVILQRIIDKAWSDVEKKVKPRDEPFEYRKRVILDQEKSKLSLAEICEQDYLKMQQKDKGAEENPKHIEIKKLMDSLLPELTALFSHIPRPAVPEITVVSNLPAIIVEEVTPIGVSDAALLAPEEIKAKSYGSMKGETEKSETDRKRERRKKKIRQKMHQKSKEEKLKTAALSSSTLAKKHAKLEALKKLKQQKSVHFSEGNNKGDKIKSSKDFFARLQDTVTQEKSITKKKSKRTSFTAEVQVICH